MKARENEETVLNKYTGARKNFNLPKNQPLVPLFEAIVNSIHVIDERKTRVLSYNKNILDAKKRNKILFDKLGI